MKTDHTKHKAVSGSLCRTVKLKCTSVLRVSISPDVVRVSFYLYCQMEALLTAHLQHKQTHHLGDAGPALFSCRGSDDLFPSASVVH